MDKTSVASVVCIVVLLLGVIGGITYAHVRKYAAMSEMVSKGANPQVVACAMDGVNSLNQQVCLSVSVNK